MNLLKVFYIFTFSVCCLIGLASYSSGEVVNRIAAVVNDSVITLYELNSSLKEVTGLDPEKLRAMDEDRYLRSCRRVLDRLINERIAREKIKELGIEVTPEEVDSYIRRVEKERGLTHEELVTELEKRGLSYEDYRERVKHDLEKMRLIQREVKSKIVVTDEAVAEYYNNHQDQFRTNEQVRLSSIFLKRGKTGDKRDLVEQRAEEILSRLADGESFGALAGEYSEGPGAEEGGDLGYFKVADLDPKLRAVIEDLPPGGVSEPIERSFGLQIIMVVDRKEGGVKPLEAVKDTIYRELYRQEVNRKYSSWIKMLRNKAYTKVLYPKENLK